MSMFEPNTTARILLVYGWEIIEIENAVSSAFSRLSRMSSSGTPNASGIHSQIRQILTDSGLISLMLFPVSSAGNMAKSRAELLRSEFGVTSGSLLESRALRNDLSHLDERLDNWTQKSKKKTFGRGMLGSRVEAKKIGLNDEDILGLFDPRTLCFSFGSNDLQVDDLVAEIRCIAHAARQKLRELSWPSEGK